MPIDKTKRTDYTVKNVKTFDSHDGGGYNCTLYRENKKIATAHDGGYGGGVELHWLDRDTGKKENGLPVLQPSIESIRFYDMIKDLEPVQYHEEPLSYNDNMFVGELVNEYELNKQYKRWCRKQTVFRVKGDPEGEFRTLNASYIDRTVDFIKAKYGETLDYILNEKIGQKVGAKV